jgi:hypothetical protein
MCWVATFSCGIDRLALHALLHVPLPDYGRYNTFPARVLIRQEHFKKMTHRYRHGQWIAVPFTLVVGMISKDKLCRKSAIGNEKVITEIKNSQVSKQDRKCV